MIFTLTNLFCAASFTGYGLSCLLTVHMKSEFARYGLPRYRMLTGALQLLGAIGLLIGFQFSLIGAMAAAGLALQMLLGFGVRLKIRDGFFQSFPALFYLAISSWLAFQFASRLTP